MEKWAEPNRLLVADFEVLYMNRTHSSKLGHTQLFLSDQQMTNSAKMIHDINTKYQGLNTNTEVK